MEPQHVRPASSHRADGLRATVLGWLAVVAAGAALGGLGAWAWWSWWSPGFDGEKFQTTDGPVWLPEPFDPGFADSFTGTAQYALLGFGLGIVLGLLAAVLFRRRAVAGIPVLVAASALAAVVMLLAGTAPSPVDPQTLASAETVGETYPAHLAVTGWTTYLAWPVGALFAYTAFMLLSAGALNVRAREQRPGWLAARRHGDAEPLSPAGREPSPRP